MLEATINCDMGESYGQWSLGADADLIPIVDYCNVAAGFHGGDFDTMAATVRLAKQHGRSIGVHPALPDLQGFGRREMHLPPASFFNCILYQVGALSAYCKLEGVELSHIKPHGQCYIMSSKDIVLAREAAKAAKLYDVPMLGLPGSAHQEACEEAGVSFIPEFYADLMYRSDGKLIGPRSAAERHPFTPEDVYDRVRTMLETGTWKSFDGSECQFPAGTSQVSICVHGDFPGAVETAKAVRRAIDDVKASC